MAQLALQPLAERIQKRVHESDREAARPQRLATVSLEAGSLQAGSLEERLENRDLADRAPGDSSDSRDRPNAPDLKRRKAVAPPLDEAEAELFARLSPVLTARPLRSGHQPFEPPATYDAGIRAEVSPADPGMAEGPTDGVRPPPLPWPELTPATDLAEPARQSKAPRLITFMHRARRERWRNRVKFVFAWSLTLLVIAITVGGAFAALLGPERASALVDAGLRQSADALQTAQALVAPLLRQCCL